MTRPAPDCAAASDQIVRETTVIGILEFAGLHRCPHVTDRPVFCGCASGRCQQQEINGERADG